ncbi:MAG: ATP-binding cassette domain-containing protein, partial [Clostridiales bacterium]|nr:ATP-binding cassette domain-containing protein [Clostridiales bacterium]
MIELRNITKSYTIRKRGDGAAQALKSLFRPEKTTVEAVRNLNFTVGEGEIVGYIGPNGAGKSTTIKIMCGILRPDSGECVINGYVPWKSRAEYVRGIGVVFGQRS